MDIHLLCFSWVSFILIRFCNGAIFNLDPSDLSVVEGKDAFFVCFVSEMDDGQYVSWMKDTTQISTDNTLLLYKNDYEVTRMLVDRPRPISQCTLQIKSVERKDGLFSYSCRVYNSDGTVDASSKAARLTVIEVPAEYYPHCEITPGPNYRDGNEVSITCTVELTEPPVSLQLRKNGQDVHGSETSSPKTDTVKLTHTFRAYEDNNGDVFTCDMFSTSTDLYRNCTTSPLVFNYIPRVTIQGPSVIGDSEAIYFCTSKAMPAASKYVWSLSRDIGKSRYTTDSSQILRITQPGEDLSGLVITCTVINSIGESTDKMTLTSFETPPVRPTTIPPVSRNASETFLLAPPRAATNSSTDDWHDNIVTVAIIAGLALVVFILLALLPIVCIKYYQKSSHRYDQARAESETYMFSDPRVRPQPIPLPLPLPLPIEEEQEEPPQQWTRSIGTQVTEEEVETPTDPIYIEIPPDRHTYSSSSL